MILPIGDYKGHIKAVPLVSGYVGAFLIGIFIRPFSLRLYGS